MKEALPQPLHGQTPSKLTVIKCSRPIAEMSLSEIRTTHRQRLVITDVASTIHIVRMLEHLRLVQNLRGLRRTVASQVVRLTDMASLLTEGTKTLAP